jgi:spermidine/putrescine transport system ATP-binding protein
MLRGTVEDVIYLGSQTKYWVRVGEYRISIVRQHTRFFLDEKPIKWGEEVWISWHADDGFMLEKYSEQDENLLRLPPEAVGETPVEPVEPAPAPAAEEARP